MYGMLCSPPFFLILQGLQSVSYTHLGGAVLTQEYADMIHADFYSKDAMGSVYYAQRLFGKE